MKRLTELDEYGNADIIGVNSPDLQLHLEFDEFNRVTDALNKLAAYEDMGIPAVDTGVLTLALYTYDLPTFWVDVKPYGNSYKMVKAPILPAWALPKGYGDKQNFREGDFVDDNAETLADVIQNKPDEVLSKNEADVLLEALKIDEERGLINIERCLKYFGVDSVYKLTGRQKGIILQTVNKREKDLEEKSTDATGKRKGGK